ncbi:unnamed protein product [Dracunculus medinensis]|uniref:Adenylyl cyclase-associated protein n=1 Tax=Dracunculus medinensis TaxID=318479 RepID=A0A0N4UJD7_DRAME|nr:unnamed protein product [Dracunculus medinensis]
MMATAVDIERNFIWIAAGKEEPTAEEKQQMLSPMFDLIKEVSQMAESKRKETTSNHISAVSDGIQIFGWLIMKPAVISYVNDMIDAATFFANRVMSDYKVDNKNPHSNWAKALLEVLNAIKSYVSQYHSKGLIWNTDPGASPQKSVSSVAAPSGLSQSPVASAVLPPPPPPPPPLPGLKCGTDNANVDRAALFAEINTGENITRRLKKVTADMQTHKNPALRAHIDETKFPKINEILRPSSVANKIDVEKTTKAKTFLENGKQWNIEYHKNNQNIVVEINDMKQTVYVFKCENSIIQIKGKLNSITLDGCKKVAIVFDSLLSQVEVINCQRMKIETRGAMPTLSIQKTDGCQVFLSKEAMSNAEIITSKSSEMNILVPIGADGDFVIFFDSSHKMMRIK